MDITGKPMGGFVWVDADAALEVELTDWIDSAARYVGGLPPKQLAALCGHGPVVQRPRGTSDFQPKPAEPEPNR
jgi:hypothetical protein